MEEQGPSATPITATGIESPASTTL